MSFSLAIINEYIFGRLPQLPNGLSYRLSTSRRYNMMVTDFDLEICASSGSLIKWSPIAHFSDVQARSEPEIIGMILESFYQQFEEPLVGAIKEFLDREQDWRPESMIPEDYYA